MTAALFIVAVARCRAWLIVTAARAQAWAIWARRAIALRLHGITIDVTGTVDEPFTWPDPVRETIRPDLAAPEPHLPEPTRLAPPDEHARHWHEHPEPTRKATGDEMRDAEVRATRPWSDDTGSFTAFVEEGA